MTVTKFKDMHSGGGRKTDYDEIYIEAPRDRAIACFKSYFDRDPHQITCQCCGADYSITDFENLRQATAHSRNCDYDTEQGMYVEEPDFDFMERTPLDEFLEQDDILWIDGEIVSDVMSHD